MLIRADARSIPLASGSVQCCVTSPPYWGLRKYEGEQELIWRSDDLVIERFENHKIPESQNHPMEWRGALGHEPLHDCLAWAKGDPLCNRCYVCHVVLIFREVRCVLRDDGTCWLNMGDAYSGSWGNQGRKAERGGQRPINGPILQRVQDGRYPVQEHNTGDCPPGLKPKDLCGIPWRVAMALQADGWYLRSDIIWSKPNPMPESVRDRPTKAHEYVFLLTKSPRYFYDAEAVAEPHKRLWDASNGGNLSPDGIHKRHDGFTERGGHYPLPNPAGRNLRSVWEVATQPYSGSHFATFPERIPEIAIRAGTSERGCCPKCGAPWARKMAKKREFTRPIPDHGKYADGFKSEHRTKAGLVGRPIVFESQTLGWKPTCQCDAGDPVPCIVLDPFAGSGTTGEVAYKLGRRFVMVDLAYQGHQAKRIPPMALIS